ncbi:DUF726-domain-containing protein [Saccharata proteae CBS 121410]|uniref:DUF726-domain-containing protein n=1 Tax=Saccharata proteae CBS 121410 TaxID=1314787 RepID=A0A9P4HWA3_9PEZI|nr:DUF726-domain-containing protein [Saccharata proteae CBS 121410]
MFSNVSNVFKSDQRKKGGSQEDASLETLLPTQELRNDFALLVVECVDRMRQDLNATFEIPPELISASTLESASSDSADLISFDDYGSDVAGPNSAEEAKERVRIARERLRKLQQELARPETKQLHEAALQFFNNWRLEVLRRVGEVLHVKSEVVRRLQQERAQKPTTSQTDLLSHDPSTSAHRQRQPIPTTLSNLPDTSRTLLLHSLLLLLLSLTHYPAHSRLLLQHISSALKLPRSLLPERETAVAAALLSAAAEAAPGQMSADEETARHARSGSTGRRWKVGAAAVGGAILIGVTGGLAAPLLAAGVGTVLGGVGLGATAVGGLLGGLAGSSVLVGGLFGAYGGKMMGEMVANYAREVRDFKFIPVKGERAGTHRFRVAIAISGWLADEQDIVDPWRVLGADIESFALRWEVEALMKLGVSLSAVLRSYAWDYAKLEIVRRTIFGTLAAGLWPLGLVKLARVVDNPFNVAKARSDKAGAVLADALINRAQGERPVTLVGYSLGARVIYSCLQTLAERRAFGLVETVVFMGAPAPSDAAAWRSIRSVVAGRVVNVYSSNDYILGFLYRTSSVQLGVAGLQAVEDVPGVENLDVSSIVSGHTKYRWLVGNIMMKIGIEDLDDMELEREMEMLKVVEKKEEQAKDKRHKEVDDGVAEGQTAGEDVIMEERMKKEAELLEKEAGVWEVEDEQPKPKMPPRKPVPPPRPLPQEVKGEEPPPTLPLRPRPLVDDRTPSEISHPQSITTLAPPEPANSPKREETVERQAVIQQPSTATHKEDNHSDYEYDAESVRTASTSDMQHLAPEAEPDSEPEDVPARKNKTGLYSALD